MLTDKQTVKAMLQHLPEGSTFEDIQYHLYVLEKIKKGQNDIANGRSYNHEEAKTHLSKQ